MYTFVLSCIKIMTHRSEVSLWGLDNKQSLSQINGTTDTYSAYIKDFIITFCNNSTTEQ